jgi:threonine dehydratase
MITLADVVAAEARIRDHVHRTPVVTCRSLDAAAGVEVFLKVEGFQKGGSFKVRGATNAALQLTSEERDRGILAYSSGNHAQGVALAARTVGTTAIIVMPDDAPAPKRAAVIAYGAEIRSYDRRTGNREEIAAALARETGRAVIPPFNDPRVIAGQGTVALELTGQTPPLEGLLVPLGGGGLLSGCATVAAERWPGCRVFGVEPEAADDGRRSLEAGRIVRIEEPETIADGLRPRSLGDLTFEIIRKKTAGVLTVTEEAIAAAVLFLMQRTKLVVEPSAAVGVAALLSGAAPFTKGQRIGVVLSGGNIDPAVIPELVRMAGA